ncbi:hypothetical protein GOP47_0019310 [Adiantum capillus-veneris]|uniref:STM1-like N-terminal domain-containing protein n=1 Tax=Adiantum capillus-veneris TaxID=13818 RepID=A0A9D4ZBI7_ADICA|nr:hypothetical protein GOP47_0018681 [Adiantum capillus-veneris]KAI5066686.1 hypothetical protein GOP47_0019310 [Adiantum capillus-veneris]
MATQNLFELLGDEETDASAVIERAEALEKVKKKQQQQEKTRLPQQDPPNLPSKPLPPAQAVRELKAGQQESGRGPGGRGRGQGNRDRDYSNNYRNQQRDFNGGSNPPSQEGGFQRNRNFDRNRDGDGFQINRGRFYGQGRPPQTLVEDGESGHNIEGERVGGNFRGGARRQGRPFGQNYGGFGEGQQQRAYVRKDVAPRPQEAQDKLELGDVKEADVGEKQSVVDKPPVEEPKSDLGGVAEKKEPEDKDNEMLLDDYYKVLDEKTKHLKPQRSGERKVVADKDFAKMTKVERKQDEGDFVKLGSEKDKGKKKEVVTNMDERARKNVSINEFLRPAEGEQYHGYRRGRDRGGRERGPNERGEGYKGGFGGYSTSGQQDTAPRIEDPSQFPTLGAP